MNIRVNPWFQIGKGTYCSSIPQFLYIMSKTIKKLKECTIISSDSAEIIVCLSKRSVDPAYRGPVGPADRTGVSVCVKLAGSTCHVIVLTKAEASCEAWSACPVAHLDGAGVAK